MNLSSLRRADRSALAPDAGANERDQLRAELKERLASLRDHCLTDLLGGLEAMNAAT